MRRIILLAALALLAAAMLLANAVPALAAPPTLEVSCNYSSTGFGFVTSDPKEFGYANNLYRDCISGGGTASRDLTSNPGKPIP